MTFSKTKIKGVFLIEPKLFKDIRGKFIKIYNEEMFAQQNLPFIQRESYYSTSMKNVIRGMHFQTPPKEYVKLVYVTKGKILDVILDIRKDSKTYGKHISAELSSENCRAIYIPAGCAHGFLSLANDSTVIYLQTSTYSRKLDGGIRFDSFGMNWGTKNPILSDRDKSFPSLKEFDSPFKYENIG